MSIPGHAVHLDLTVPFHHCDPLGVVWHGRYFEYFEQTRTELMRSIALDVDEIQKLGFKLFVVDARCRFLRPLLYGDRFRTTGWLLAPRPHVRVAFQIENLTRGGKSARATLTFATTTFDGTLLTAVPAPFLERFPDGL